MAWVFRVCFILALFCVCAPSLFAARTLTARSGYVVVDPWYRDYVTLDPTLVLTNDGQKITTVSITFKSGYVVGDTLTVNASIAAANGINAAFNSTTGVMTLRSIASSANASQFQTVLRNLNYYLDIDQFTSNPGSFAQNTLKVLEIIVFESGAELNFGTDLAPVYHFYDYITELVNWGEANASAALQRYYGIPGYLATITSKTENDFLRSKAGDNAGWLGGSDSASEGTWKWVTGPEVGTVIASSPAGLKQETPTYANWNNLEPNNLGNEDYLQMTFSDVWNDLPYTSILAGYFVEYGGLSISSSAKNIIRVQLLYPNAIEKALVL